MRPCSFWPSADVQTLLRLLCRRTRCRGACGRSRGACLYPARTFLVAFRLASLQFRSRLVVGEIAEHLHSAGILLAGENSVVLIDIKSGERLKHSWQPAVRSHPDQQIAFGREALNTILNRVGDPDVPINIDGDS